jgi:hypothetical protein
MEVQGNGLSRQGTTATDQGPGMAAAAVLAPEHARHVGTSHLPCLPPSGLRERALLMPSLSLGPLPPSCLFLKTRAQRRKSTLTLVLAWWMAAPTLGLLLPGMVGGLCGFLFTSALSPR